jgi:hypothetical protein
MNQPPAFAGPPILTGQHIGETAAVTRAVLGRLLSSAGATFENWTILNSLWAKGGSATRKEFIADFAPQVATEPAAASALVDAAIAEGLVSETEGTVEFTPAGRETHGKLQGLIRNLTRQMYGDIDPEDQKVARRTLDTIAERARKLLAEG